MRGVKTSRSALGMLFSAMFAVAGMLGIGMAANTAAAPVANATCYASEMRHGLCYDDRDYDRVNWDRDRCDYDRGCGQQVQLVATWDITPWDWNEWCDWVPEGGVVFEGRVYAFTAPARDWHPVRDRGGVYFAPPWY